MARQPLMSVAVAFLFVVVFPVGMTAETTEDEKSSFSKNNAQPITGAIRWDGWNAWDLWQKCFDSPDWRDRLPFFATISSEGKACVREDSQEVIDQEIAYAKAGGLDYWAFCFYHPDGWPPHSAHMAKCLQLYLASSHKRDIHYSLIISGGLHLGPKEKLSETMDYFVQRFKEPNYQKVLGDRPLVYFFEIAELVKTLGSEEVARDWLKRLRQKTINAGAGNPYFVVMAFWPPSGAEQLDKLGCDAISSYTGHCLGQKMTNKEHPYSKLAENNRTFWENAKKTKKAYIPTLNAGWDFRPMKRPEFPDRDPKDDWYIPPTPRELADNLNSALDWVKTNPSTCPANAVLIYAWNEFAEGGWLVPTKKEGTARLDALAEAVRERAVKK